MEKEKNELQQITKLSDIIRAKYKRIKSNKISSEDKVNKVFKPVVEPLKELVEISKNDKIKLENENDIIKRENNLFENQLFYTNSFDKDSDYNNLTFKDNVHDKTIPESHKSLNDINGEEDLDDYQSIISEAATSKRNYQIAFNDTIDNSFEAKRDELLKKVQNGDKAIDKEVGVRQTLPNKFMFGNQVIKFENDKFIIKKKEYTLTDGLLELLFKKTPNPQSITEDDYDVMKELFENTHAHRMGYLPSGTLRIQNSKLDDLLPFIYDKYGNGLTYPNKIKNNLLDYMVYNDNTVDYVYWNDPNELVSRLRLLIASQTAGNTNHSNEIISIIEELREAEVIY